MLPSGAEIRVVGIETHQSYALVVSVPEEMSADKLAALRQGLHDITDKLHGWWAGEEKFCDIIVREDLVLRFERTEDAPPRPAVIADFTKGDGFGHPMSYRYDPAQERTEHEYDG